MRGCFIGFMNYSPGDDVQYPLAGLLRVPVFYLRISLFIGRKFVRTVHAF